MDVQAHKIGMESLASLAQLDKAGMLPSDHVDAQQVQTGTDYLVSAVLVDDNGILVLNNAFAHQEIGTASHASHVPLANNGTQLTTHVHAHPIQTGMVLIVEHVQDQTDSGIIN